MKTRLTQVFGTILFISYLFIFLPLGAQNGEKYLSINGIVKDKKTKKKLENVSISISNSNIGTVTNDDGEFTIQVKNSLHAKYLDLSSIGYINTRLEIDKISASKLEIFMEPALMLKEIVIKGDPLKLVQEAMNNIEKNYCPKTNLLTGFYRETTKKRNSYINISEAVVDICKTPYNQSTNEDKLQICKGRNLLSQKKGDTLVVKLQGGPNLCIFLDIVKNPDLLLNEENLSYYTLSFEEPLIFNDRVQYVVSFTPKFTAPVALYYGKFYIDKENSAFSRIEFFLSMDDKQKAIQAILRKKPYNLKFKPEEVSFLVSYKLGDDGISYLNYIKNEIRFKCDWKKKLFSTSYTILSEMVVTDITDRNTDIISNKNKFKSTQSLTDNLSFFYDENFWEDYNIIEPTESLESAVKKLKKQYK